jgi:hypothetical protein
MMDDRAQIGEVGTVDGRIAEMRRLLDTMAEQSASEALSALRDAFPDSPLGERVRAMKFSRH